MDRSDGSKCNFMNIQLDNEIQQACELVSNCEATCKEADRRLYYAKEVLRGLKEQERRETEAEPWPKHTDCTDGHCLEKNGRGDCNPNADVKQAFPAGRWT